MRRIQMSQILYPLRLLIIVSEGYKFVVNFAFLQSIFFSAVHLREESHLSVRVWRESEREIKKV